MKEETRPAAARQLAMALDVPGLQGLTAIDRAQAVNLLAQLLLEASGLGGEEDDGEEV